MGNGFDKITEKIYLGDYTAATEIQKLKDTGITKVLTVMDYEGGPKYNSDEFTHKRFKVMDDEHQNIIQYFGECLNYMKEDKKILVHCMAGASRSATIVIAYLMWTEKLKFVKAFDFVKEKRPIVCPNMGFQDQLKLFEKLLEENNYDINKIKFSEIKWVLPPGIIY